MQMFLTVLRFFVLLPFHWLVTLLCYILAPVLPLTAIGKETLPKWLSWFQTPDAPLDGDLGFRLEHEAKGTHPYLQRVYWLWRNPAYGFSWGLLAYQSIKGMKIHTLGDIKAKDDPYKAGWSISWTEDKKAFQVRAFVPTIPGKCLKFRFGWKLRWLVNDCNGIANGSKRKFVFTCNPFKSRRP
ncbi:hypothetical protein [Vibrio phage vB_VmeM-Yong XC32]|nr:hypothetical protein [Vibrio phage vB_VmeM-Yong XC31]QAX96510.1 hypothetical protein [Vibrio phage vB_VmeM-Yong XC32]QAX96827.1 hypothetical protein [Vibrio phage vB_VmeM-Yong MS31]